MGLTDAHGEFQLKEAKTLRWLPMVCYAPTAIQYRVESPGYEAFSTNLLGGGSFSEGMKPHMLGRVTLERRSR